MRDYWCVPHRAKEKIFIQYMGAWQAANWIWCVFPLCRSKCGRWNTSAERKRLSQPQLLWHESSIYSSISGFDGQHPALRGPPSALLPATAPLGRRGRPVHRYLFPESRWGDTSWAEIWAVWADTTFTQKKPEWWQWFGFSEDDYYSSGTMQIRSSPGCQTSVCILDYIVPSLNCWRAQVVTQLSDAHQRLEGALMAACSFYKVAQSRCVLYGPDGM